MSSVSLSCKAPARSEPGALSIIFLSPFTMNVANQLYHPCEYKTIAEMYEEHITHTVTELNAHQSNLKIDFLLLSRTFLPLCVRPTTMVSVDTMHFQDKVSNFF